MAKQMRAVLLEKAEGALLLLNSTSKVPLTFPATRQTRPSLAPGDSQGSRRADTQGGRSPHQDRGRCFQSPVRLSMLVLGLQS